MEKKILEYILKENLIDEDDHVVIGVSGGADSVCLLHLLHKLQGNINFTLSAAHINHGIRGIDADADEEFVKELCRTLEVPFYSYKINIKEESKRLKVSEEEAGRIVRYNVFNQILDQYKKGKIAVGHHMNDQGETVLINLIRGSGIKGLLGMSPKRENIIRPLLMFKREDIIAYLNKNQLKYKEDYTNSQDIYLRNKIRLNIIPYIEANINEKVIDKIVQTTELLKEDDDYLNINTNELLKELIISQEEDNIIIRTDELLDQHIAMKKRLIREVINRVSTIKNMESIHIDQVLGLANKEVGKKIDLPNNLLVKKHYDALEFSFLKNNQEKPAHLQKEKCIIKIPSSYYIQSITKQMKTSLINHIKEEDTSKKTYTKFFDYDRIKSALCLRTRETGDFIVLKGINGRKKLKDYFIDNKIPKEKRDEILLIADGNHIIWIIGYRVSEEYKVTEKTQKILKVEITDTEDL
ncbi:tRNA(Ile)-lysidine synthase [Natranaerovirga pectinivora]|uniref:tRNA(Ile)-lysidine synthase n=1 Tax=Natranaerovirga pectinivora TaxID=682400 RepID=A0A4R3MM41_9FIRM|nr:tRNA lysidine(34) synthetase TilS [Natranaerovirga pectinivora]TCT13046.1 tRNA(Ile)-lysidine synthase [Natranaerovirga pectinivora]